MVRVIEKKEQFIPIVDLGGILKIAFDYNPVMVRDAEGNNVESGYGKWSEHIFKKRLTFLQIKDFILSEINKATDERILSGFIWKDMQVWLSSENQFNYKAAYDLAVQTNGENLPTVFKFGSTDNPVYYKFETIEELTDFYTKAVKFINEQLAIGWAKKDSINWDDYKLP